VTRGTGTALLCGAIVALLLPASAAAVVGGQRADLAEWGFTVAIRQKKSLICTGSVIAPTKALTAAHCARHRGARSLRVVAGRVRLRHNPVGEVIEVTDARRYPTYRRNERHDLAVLTLAEPTTAPPIQLATPAEDAALTQPGRFVRVAGYGDRKPLFTEPTKIGVLTEARERVRTKQRCVHAYRREYIARAMICSLGLRFSRKPIGSTTCVGDSGGPMVADSPEGPRLVGVTSFGAGAGNIFCGARSGPSVSARVSAGLGFIERYRSAPG
ncbi:MAG: S1 family peptidase, partial [Solirubrobacterales bacterium]